MNINIGEETVNQFFTAGLVRSAADLYTVKAPDVLRLERWARKSVDNFIESVRESKKTPFERVLFALGIPEVGETTAKRLATAFHNIDALMSATVEQLTAVEDIGATTAASVTEFFAEPANSDLIARLREYGLQFAIDESVLAEHTDILGGKSFVISGTFSKHSRDEYKTMIERNGGKNVGYVSSKTDYILAGENMGPAKLEKAQKLGIKIISEDEFSGMMQ
jgi:DNA ligase (NAD+)